MENTQEKMVTELPILETERLILRKMSINDAEDMFEYARNPEVSKYVTWPTHQSIEDSRKFLRMVEDLYTNNAYTEWGVVFKENSKFIGTAGYHRWEKSNSCAEIGYTISQDYWGKGLMTEAVIRIIQFGFEEMELNRIEARCKIENAASERVMQKVGMTYEGTNRQRMFAKGEYHDLKMYSILNEEWTALK